MPIYSVTQTGSLGLPRMVEATKPAEALNHVIADTFVVERVDGRDLIELTKAGVALETAGEAPNEEPEGDQKKGEEAPAEEPKTEAPETAQDDSSGFDNQPINWEEREKAQD